MNDNNRQTEIARLLPLTVVLWLMYLLTLAIIDALFYPRPVFPPLFYLLSAANALIVLALALWSKLRVILGRAWLPLAIGLMSAAPISISHLAILPLPAIQARSPEALTLRLMPILFMALVLTAWHYRWRAVLLFSGGVALFTLAANMLIFRPGSQSLAPPLTALLIQTTSFLVAGFFIRTLVQRLHQQQEALAVANARLTNYVATLEELTISRERNRMARELHDTLAHTLSALSVHLETMRAYWQVDPATARQLLDQARDVTRSGLQETRQALKSLRATPLDDLGLLAALRRMADELAQRANLQLELDLPPELPALPQAVEQCLYRVAQEASSNVAYHANAHTLTVRITCDGGLTLLVADDGCGFETEHVVTSGHYGLAGMRERAMLVGGKLRIASRPGQGTRVELVIDAQGEAGIESNHLR